MGLFKERRKEIKKEDGIQWYTTCHYEK